jgi:hypothetical protein
MAGARWSSCRQNNSSCDRRWPLPATGVFSDAEVIRKFGASRRLPIFSNQRVGWVERSDTHQLHLMEMMGFAGSTHPTYCAAGRRRRARRCCQIAAPDGRTRADALRHRPPGRRAAVDPAAALCDRVGPGRSPDVLRRADGRRGRCLDPARRMGGAKRYPSLWPIPRPRRRRRQPTTVWLALASPQSREAKVVLQFAA